jgi:hypothetical protein
VFDPQHGDGRLGGNAAYFTVHEGIEHDVAGAGNYRRCHALYDGNEILWVSQANSIGGQK